MPPFFKEIAAMIYWVALVLIGLILFELYLERDE